MTKNKPNALTVLNALYVAGLLTHATDHELRAGQTPEALLGGGQLLTTPYVDARTSR